MDLHVFPIPIPLCFIFLKIIYPHPPPSLPDPSVFHLKKKLSMTYLIDFKTRSGLQLLF